MGSMHSKRYETGYWYSNDEEKNLSVVGCSVAYDIDQMGGLRVRAPPNASDIRSDCCLLTPSLDEWISSPKAAGFCIQKLNFVVESQEHEGEHITQKRTLAEFEDGSTWFEAVIIREFQDPSLKDPYPSEIEKGIKLAFERDSEIENDHSSCAEKLVTVYNPQSRSDSWLIQTNSRRLGGFRKYNVHWSITGDEDNVRSPVVREHLYQTGAGLGAGFIRSLCPGDRVAIVARAKAGWENHIKSVAIEVHYSIVGEGVDGRLEPEESKVPDFNIKTNFSALKKFVVDGARLAKPRLNRLVAIGSPRGF